MLTVIVYIKTIVIVVIVIINKLELHIKWDEIIDYQFKCLKNGLNGVGYGCAYNFVLTTCTECVIWLFNCTKQ